MNSLLYVHQLSSELSGQLLIAGWVKKQTVTWVAWGLAEGKVTAARLSPPQPAFHLPFSLYLGIYL